MEAPKVENDEVIAPDTVEFGRDKQMSKKSVELRSESPNNFHLSNNTTN